MKLKSLLFGSAAVLAAGTGAQAADLPVAEPVEYVRICDAFGAGFYYIPGTDTCLRVGGTARYESHYVWFGSEEDEEDNFDAFFEGVGEDEDDFNKYTTRGRGDIFLDARTQTDFGLIRAFIKYTASVGPDDFADNYSSAGFDIDDVLIQVANDWGTMKAGHTSSNFDYYGSSTFGTRVDIDDPTTDANQLAYTFALGDTGASVTFAVEDAASAGRREEHRTDPGSATFDEDYEGQEFPDGVANLRLDGGWGGAQLSGAVHGIHDEEFDDDYELGFAVGGGGFINVPFIQGGVIRAGAGYSDGAIGYVTSDPLGYGNFEDGETTEAWSVLAGFDAGLTQRVLFTMDGSYTNVELDDEEYEFYAVVANLRYTPVDGFYMGVEGAWNHVEENEDGDVDEGDRFKIMTRVNRDF